MATDGNGVRFTAAHNITDNTTINTSDNVTIDTASVPTLSRRQFAASLGFASIGAAGIASITSTALGSVWSAAYAPHAQASNAQAAGAQAWAAQTASKSLPHALFATWGSSNGYHAGILFAHSTGIVIGHTVPLPTRAHGVLQLPNGDILISPRRPGDWLMRWHAQATAVAPIAHDKPPRTSMVWADADYTFNGHAATSLDGKYVYTTETDPFTGDGCLAVRDSRNLAVLQRWTTHGLDPHEILVRKDGIWVANGGIATARITGRQKHDVANMDSSLVQLDATTGKRISQWRVSDPQLSIRHLANNHTQGENGTIAVSLQAQHSDTTQREQANILAMCQPPVIALGTHRQATQQRMQTIRLHPATHHDGNDTGNQTGIPVVPDSSANNSKLKGYGGDIATWQDGFAISAPRANCIVLWQPSRTTHIPLPKGCALASSHSPDGNHHLWAGGRGKIVTLQSPHTLSSPAIADDIQLDNHWILLR